MEIEIRNALSESLPVFSFGGGKLARWLIKGFEDGSTAECDMFGGGCKREGLVAIGLTVLKPGRSYAEGATVHAAFDEF